MDKPYNYWFPMPSLDNHMVHVIGWAEYLDESGVPHNGFNLAPPIVIAVKVQDYRDFREAGLEKQIKYANDHNSLGRWIPSGSDLAMLPSYDLIESRIMDPSLGERFIDAAVSAMNDVLPYHMPPNFGKGDMLAHYLGFSNMVLVSGTIRKGVCYEKSTLLKSIIGDRYDAQIVGFNEFDPSLWKEICCSYPPHEIKPGDRTIPAIFFGEAIRQGLVDHSRGSAGCNASVGDKLSLHADYPAIDHHYWVQVSIDGNIVDLDTSPKEARDDPSYQFMLPYFTRMKSRCATYQLDE